MVDANFAIRDCNSGYQELVNFLRVSSWFQNEDERMPLSIPYITNSCWIKRENANAGIDARTTQAWKRSS